MISITCSALLLVYVLVPCNLQYLLPFGIAAYLRLVFESTHGLAAKRRTHDHTSPSML